MSLHTIIVRSEKFVSDNSPTILTGIGVAGVLSTAYLSGKASIKAHQMLEADPYLYPADAENNRDKTNKEKFLLVWKLYLPAGGMAVTTIAAIILANRIGTRRAAAMAAAYTVAERGFQEYREKVAETIGKKKETQIRDEIAQDRVTRAGINEQTIIVGGGDVLFMDRRSGRVFKSTMEEVKHAINKVNHKINGSVYASLNDFYDAVGLSRLPDGDDFGWSNMLLDVHFSTTVTDDQRPCFEMQFTVEPVRGYHKIHP